MWLFSLAWKNLWRNKWRTFITVMAVSFAVLFSTAAESLKQGVFDNLVKNVVSFYTGVIQMHRKGYQNEQILDNGFLQDTRLQASLLQIPGITGMTPRLESFALVSKDDRTKGCMVAGISPDKETAVTLLGNRLIAGKYLSDSDKAVILGQGLAAQLDVRPGDTVIIFGQGYHGSMAAGKYPVKGVVRFGTPALNDKYLALPLQPARELFDAPGLSTSCIFSISNSADMDQVASRIASAAGPSYEVMTWEDILPEIKQHIETDSNNMRVFQIVLYFLIGFGILGTLLMLMIERKYETGMLIAIGMQKSKLMIMFIYESLLTVLVGCLTGIIISFPVVYFLHSRPLRLGGEAAKAYERFGFEPVFPASMNPGIFLMQAGIVCVLGFLLSLYPVIKVLLLKPVEAMKK